LVIKIDRIVEQFRTDSGEKDGQNLSDACSVAVRVGAKCFKWFPVTALVLGLFLCSCPSFRIAMGTVTCMGSRIVVTQPGGGIGFVAHAVLLNSAAHLMFFHQIVLGLEWASFRLFLASLVFLKWRSTPSVPSMTHRTRGSES